MEESANFSSRAKSILKSYFCGEIAAHVIPFIAWMVLMVLLEKFGADGAWKYMIRTIFVSGLLVIYKPWRYYNWGKVRDLWFGVLTGIIVFAIWVLPELTNGEPFFLQEFYLKYCILPLGEITVAEGNSIYEPTNCGWFLWGVRLFGSAIIIAIAEEFFWRGFLYRWLIKQDFLKIKLDKFSWSAVLIMGAMFGIEHTRWLVGIIAGVSYLLLMLKFRNIYCAIVAHIVTNLLLGVYILLTGYYQFW